MVQRRSKENRISKPFERQVPQELQFEFSKLQKYSIVSWNQRFEKSRSSRKQNQK